MPRPPVVQGSKAPSPPRVPTPPAPQVANAKGKSVPPPRASEPLESGWDDVVTHLSSSAVIAAATDAREVPAVAPTGAAPPAGATPPRAPSSGDLAPMARRARSSPDLAPTAPTRPRSSPDLAPTAPMRPRSSPDLGTDVAAAVGTTAAAEPTAAAAAPSASAADPAAQLQSLSHDVQEQLFGVLRAALDASLVPLLEKQQELEARLEALKAAEKGGAPTGSIPVMVGPSVAPPATSLQAPKAPSFDTTPTAPLGTVAPKSPSAAPKTTSIVPTSYGFVIQSDAPPRRPSIEVALENVGPIDMPDFGRRRRVAGTVLVGLLLAGLVAAIAATILSYT